MPKYLPVVGPAPRVIRVKQHVRNGYRRRDPWRLAGDHIEKAVRHEVQAALRTGLLALLQPSIR